MNKSISIIIPAYNAEKFIGECLCSISGQTFRDFEIIISNDGSSDRTADVVQSFISEHPQLDATLISNPNGGVSLARRRGLEQAGGTWITFVDADDTLPSNALSDLHALAGDDTDLVAGYIIPPAGNLPELRTPADWQCAAIQGVIPPPVCGKLFRRTLLTPSMMDVPREITRGEDMLVNIAYAFAMTKPPKFLKNHIYNYRRNTSSVTHSERPSLDYEYTYDVYRMKAIPVNKHMEHMNSITKIRINGVLGCCRSDTKEMVQKQHPMFSVINDGMAQCGYRLSFFEWIAMKSKSHFVVKNAGLIRSILVSLKYRLYSFLRRNL